MFYMETLLKLDMFYNQSCLSMKTLAWFEADDFYKYVIYVF